MPQLDNKILANRLKSIANELIGISKNVENDGVIPANVPLMFGTSGQADLDGEDWTDAKLADYADRLYQERRRRNRYLPEHLFAEPAWDILLDLFVNGVRNRPISITSACIAGGIPPTTGLRWLGVLEKEGLLIRETSEEDARVTWARLSQYGMDVMRSYIAEACGMSPGMRSETATALLE
jgi:DNA-binding MarR family transcriptional regulator